MRVTIYISIYAVICSLIFSCKHKNDAVNLTKFTQIPPSVTGINFSNNLVENEDFNIIEYLYFYNGGGVALGDINNDGLCDIFFTSNQGSNRLYLNKGDLKFDDITESAGVAGVGNWKTGVTMADVNGDGFLDIFVCGVGNYKKFNGRNQLLLNNGNLTFTDYTSEFGLSFQGLSTQAVFFDYDNDGDLDMYLLNHSVHTVRSYGDVKLRIQHDELSGDKLYRNELLPTGRFMFVDVTKSAGIYSSQIGYGLSVGVSDLNNDGYLDIYVSNDFHENDYLYLNNGDGSFKECLANSIGHTSRFSMGNYIGDINNDGWMDIVTLDMLPKNEEIKKASGGDDPYEIFEFKRSFGYHYQFARNAVQLNRGVDKNGVLHFSEIASFSQIDATDWSWSPVIADFDNDGLKDLFIANGIVRRPNDLDYISYISNDSLGRKSTEAMIERMPEGRVPNYFFKNINGLKFQDVTLDWIGDKPSCSTGSAQADLDNDGDLDLVLNNLNDEASIIRNDLPLKNLNYIKIKLSGSYPNIFGVGAKLIVYNAAGKQVQDLVSARGWQSSSDYVVQFGLGGYKIDSLKLVWPDSKQQLVRNPGINQLITLKHSDALEQKNIGNNSGNKSLLYVSSKLLPKIQHHENSFSGFEKERLIPHSATTEGPLMCSADLNGDGLEDFFVGGGRGQAATILLQDFSGNFIHSFQSDFIKDSLSEDTGCAFFDADRDSDLDLIVVSGGQESEDSKDLQPRLYLNDGNGILTRAINRLPEFFVNASCVEAFDFDSDGDVDIFIGGRIVAGSYGVSPNSYLLVNSGKGYFTDDTIKRLPSQTLGLVTDAVWDDLNRDGLIDLLIVGEWMNITILQQDNEHHFKDVTTAWGLNDTAGWWNTISKADFDKDGDMDFFVGNLGLNSMLKASVSKPVELWVGDIDGNGSTDPILTYYNNIVSYPYVGRDLLLKQIPSLKRKFVTYESYKNATINDFISEEQRSKFLKLQAKTFASCWLENAGNDSFVIHPFPDEAQLFPVFAIEILDLNSDSILDLLVAGNHYQVQPELGRFDAGYGLAMLSNADKKMQPVSYQQSGFMVDGQVRDIHVINRSSKVPLILVTKNNDSVMAFKMIP